MIVTGIFLYLSALFCTHLLYLYYNCVFYIHFFISSNSLKKFKYNFVNFFGRHMWWLASRLVPELFVKFFIHIQVKIRLYFNIWVTFLITICFRVEAKYFSMESLIFRFLPWVLLKGTLDDNTQRTFYPYLGESRFLDLVLLRTLWNEK